MLRKGKIFEKLTKIIEDRQNLGIFSKMAEATSIGTMGPVGGNRFNRSPTITKTTMKIKNTSYLLVGKNP